MVNVIGREHGVLRQLQKQLQTFPGATNGATPDDPRRRAQALAALRDRLELHEETEPSVFWPAVRERLPDGEKLATHGMDQERAAEQLFARLYGENAPSESCADYDEPFRHLRRRRGQRRGPEVHRRPATRTHRPARTGTELRAIAIHRIRLRGIRKSHINPLIMKIPNSAERFPESLHGAVTAGLHSEYGMA